MRLGDIAQFRKRGDIAVHRIDRFERDQLWRGRREFPEPAVEVGGIVVGESGKYLLRDRKLM
jgi:hypothetical protein